MKKSFLFAAMAAIVLSGCYKNDVVEVNNGPKEISFKAVSNVATKADAQLEGVNLTSDYSIYASATQKKADGTIENGAYFVEKKFVADGYLNFDQEPETVVAGTPYKATIVDPENAQLDKFEPIYWPIGKSKVDYIAYALPTVKHGAPAAVYENLVENAEGGYDQEASNVASKVAFTWDTYENQVDLLYAGANELETATNAGFNAEGKAQTVELVFNHAQALLVFQASVNIPDVFTIKEIAINDLKVKGTFTVDNTRNNIEASWDEANLEAVEGENIIAEGKDPDADNLGEALTSAELVPVGSSLLIPEQKRQNFVITYELSGNTMKYEYNDLHGKWQMGKKYIYNLDIKLNEIVITETVENWVDVPVNDNYNYADEDPNDGDIDLK